jgi:hypothetical protein
VNPTRPITSCPPGFAEHFIRDGWRGVERVYGASTPLLLRWFEESGGPELEARRKAAKRRRSAVGVEPRRMRA